MIWIPIKTDFPYWEHDFFKQDCLTGTECKSEFRFYRNEIYRLAEVLDIPEKIICYDRSKVDGIEAFCIFSKRIAYPPRYTDIIQRRSCSVPELSLMSNDIFNKIFDGYFHLLRDFQQVLLSAPYLELFSEEVHAKRAAVDNC